MNTIKSKTFEGHLNEVLFELARWVEGYSSEYGDPLDICLCRTDEGDWMATVYYQGQ